MRLHELALPNAKLRFRHARTDEQSLDRYKAILGGAWNLPEDLLRYLKQNDFRQEGGDGSYSRVYAHPRDSIVVKISLHEFDHAYVEFVDFCCKNRGNPHLPRTGRIRTYANGGTNYFVLIVERLRPIAKEDVAMLLNNWALFLEHGTKRGEVSQQASDDWWQEEGELWLDRSNLTADDIRQVKDMALLLMNCLRSVSPRLSLDIHPGNVMQRGKTYVLADPLMP